MIDTHMHADARSSEDFEKMFIGGIDTAISCSYYPYKVNNAEILLNHLNRILNFEPKRAMEYGLELKIALGIHPANSIKDNEIIFDSLKEWIDNKDIIAIGEIGLDENTELEKEVFKKQLELAEETKSKVIVHTPRKNKLEVLKDIKEIALENINPKLVVIDHINLNTIEEIIDDDFTIGLTVQPQKMEVEEAIEILDKYDFDKFLLNSDISNKPSDPLSVPKTVRTLKRLGYKQDKIDKVAFKNAESFFNL
ncbi:hydrolase TatD family [Methanobrevibacter ruminantium M1]|uniref:Hydrolase TatD family n=1 Tax=Methanobrevibacter ruminantium (strain ATCC 35063 / DSM 1093 / JCM 13430 / OCM 146 / M1) TaxID=634498 RepID=D3E1T8_METRM|nr:TatD family hydrolase [Methanobrevibacter ruminantium]ADC46499.1 hydrolase TatD family [Methanobrevibacter ruminantium M1]